MADQVLNSVSNALFGVSLAQYSSLGDFARISIVYLLLVGLVGLNRAIVGESIQLGRLAPSSSAVTGLAGFMSLLGLIEGVIVVVAGLLLGVPGLIATLLALAMFGAAVQDGLRTYHLVKGAPFRAVLSDIVWVLTVLAPFAFDLLGHWTPSARVVVGFWTTGAIAGALIGGWRPFSVVKVDLAVAAETLLGYVKDRRSSGLEFLSVLVGSLVTLAILTSRSPQIAAEVRAAMILMAPVDSIVAGVRITYYPRLAGYGAAARRHARSYLAILGGVFTLYTAALLTLVRGAQLEEEVRAIELGMKALAPALAVQLIRVLARPTIDRALAAQQTLRIGLGRLVGEVSALAIVAIAPVTAIAFFVARGVSVIVVTAVSASVSSARDQVS